MEEGDGGEEKLGYGVGEMKMKAMWGKLICEEEEKNIQDYCIDYLKKE